MKLKPPRGSVEVSGNKVYWKVYSDVSLKNGAALPKRIQQRVPIADKSDVFAGADSPAVKTWVEKKIEEVERWEAEARNARTQAAPPVPAPAPVIPPPVTVTPDKDTPLTVDVFYEVYFKNYLTNLIACDKKAPSTLESYDRFWNAYIKRHVQGRTFAEFTPESEQLWLESLRKQDGKPLSTATMRHVHACCSGIWRRAILTGMMGKAAVTDEKLATVVNMWHSVNVADTPCVDTEDGEWFTEAEVELIVSHIESERVANPRQDRNNRLAQVAMFIGITSGLRPSEIQGLKWENIDLDTMTIKVSGAVVGTTVRKKNKTKNSARTIRYDRKLDGILRDWHRQSGCPSNGWVLTSRTGGPVNLSTLVERVIQPVCEKFGDPWKTMYGLRRGAITIRVERGWTLTEIAEWAGNSTKIIEIHYWKRRGELSRKAAERDDRKAQLEALAPSPEAGRMFREEPKQLVGVTNA